MPVESKPLFRPDVVRARLEGFTLPAIDREKLQHWARLVGSGRINEYGEQEILRDFLSDFFVGFLGYTRPAGHQRYTISWERHLAVDGTIADAVIGDFNGEQRAVAPLEGKGPRDPLDRPFAGRRRSAVEQAYQYAINLRCDWILVTSTRQTRLYHKGSDQQTFERFDTERLADDEELLRRFMFLLGAERVVPTGQRTHWYELFEESERIGRQLTKDFYVKYANLRQDAYERLAGDNPGTDRHQVLASTQKLLDRVLFTAFAEDRGLLPADSIKQAFEHRDPYHPRPVWENFRALFRYVNDGNAALGIHPYNGGLFAPDTALDSLVVADDVCKFFRDLGDYDYRPAHQASGPGTLIDVDILGHIFEQSITDLEKLRNELDGLVATEGVEKHKTRRKKEGAFYTPAFITRYIVEQALGGVLRDRFERLRSAQETAAKGAAKSALADPTVYELEKLSKPARAALVAFWEAWQDDLTTVRLLDPACGSGAFLIEAFDQLHAEYQRTGARLKEVRGQALTLDVDQWILENNLYGVDLNEEAVEICRLSLWIKTAQRGKRLTSLDHTIRVGNSVVDDPAVHPKAFDWKGAFPEVFEQGGFDVVVGNPPYIRQEWLAPYKEHWQKIFKTFASTADIFVYFFERGLSLLRADGRLAFITSGSWVRGAFAAPLRSFLVDKATVESMVDFGEYQPFEDAEMIRPTIAVLNKTAAVGEMRLFKWLTSGNPPENLTELIDRAPRMHTQRLGVDAWELEDDTVVQLRQKMSSLGQALNEFIAGRIYRGVLTGLTEAFVVNRSQRDELMRSDLSCADVITPFVQGTHLRPWYVEDSEEYLIALQSSANHSWPWSDSSDPEQAFRETYPSVYEHLLQFRERAISRQDQGRFWWELRACAYWRAFDEPKVVWPDISKLPRFSMDTRGRYLGNTGYIIPGGDYYLLAVLSSWATWFFISKTAQPLRLRGNRWQYRLIAQFMENVPIPRASDADRLELGNLARRSSELGESRYGVQTKVQHRLRESFGRSAKGGVGKLNQKAEAWWEQSPMALGAALKDSFKLPGNPFQNPRTADEWEPYLAEHRAEVDRLTRALADAEAEINDRVFRLFELNDDERALLMREVEH